MSDGGISSATQLFDGILEGSVPRQVRLFAAQGLLPISRDDVFRLQVLLTSDPDPELAATASAALQQEPEETIVELVEDHEMAPLVLDLLARVRKEEGVWAAIATRSTVSDQTLRMLARHGSALVQDIIITNQTRILDCLEILEDLRDNPDAAPAVVRRVREFEEEFIEKTLKQELVLEESRRGPSIEEALSALRSIGANIPHEDSMPYPRREDPSLAEAARQAGSAHARISSMAVKEQIVLALKGTREERAILINSRNRLVVQSVLSSPKLTDPEIEQFAQARSASDEVLRIICGNRRWLRRYGVVLALVQNPKAPLQTTLRLLSTLNQKDLARVSRNRNVHPVVRRRAEEMWAGRR
jgi:hypothetical protein